MEMKTCPQCKKEIAAVSKFCPECGFNLQSETYQTVPTESVLTDDHAEPGATPQTQNGSNGRILSFVFIFVGLCMSIAPLIDGFNLFSIIVGIVLLVIGIMLFIATKNPEERALKEEAIAAEENKYAIVMKKLQWGSEQYVSRLDANIFVPGRHNSAGGVDVRGTFKNTRPNDIKYVSLLFVPYNAVNDPVECTVRNRSEARLKITGPIKPYQSRNFYGETLWYSWSISSVKFIGAEIQYMDGTEDIVSLDEI